MSPEELVHRYVDAFNKRDIAAMHALYAEDAITYDPQRSEPIKGWDGIEAAIRMQWTAFSDQRWALPRPVVASGNRVAYEVAMQMTHDGPLPMPDGSTLEATGTALSVEFSVFLTLDDDGLIAEERGYGDATGIAVQLGLLG